MSSQNKKSIWRQQQRQFKIAEQSKLYPFFENIIVIAKDEYGFTLEAFDTKTKKHVIKKFSYNLTRKPSDTYHECPTKKNTDIIDKRLAECEKLSYYNDRPDIAKVRFFNHNDNTFTLLLTYKTGKESFRQFDYFEKKAVKFAI